MTPDRLKPGYEHRRSRKAMTVVYACFAAGMAAGTIAATPKAGRDDRC